MKNKININISQPIEGQGFALLIEEFYKRINFLFSCHGIMCMKFTAGTPIGNGIANRDLFSPKIGSGELAIYSSPYLDHRMGYINGVMEYEQY